MFKISFNYDNYFILYILYATTTCICYCRYELVAVIDFVSGGHYVTYVHRSIKNVWELHNDLTQKISTVKSEYVELHPHLLMYVQV